MHEKIETIRTLTLPDQASAFLRVCVQDTISERVQSLFQRKFHDLPPKEPIHVVAHYDGKNGESHPICYIHFYEWQSCLLGGGACVDERVLKQMSQNERGSLRNAGGPYYLSISAALGYFRNNTRAVFGYCGDPLAERIDLRAGFQKTDFKYILACWSSAMPDAEKRALLENVKSLGPF